MKSARWNMLLLCTLSLLFGLQIFRVFVDSLVNYLIAFLPAEGLAGAALAVFGLAFVMPLLRRRLGESRLLALVIAGLLTVRFLLQMMGSPEFRLGLGAAGVALLAWFLPAWHFSRLDRQTGGPHLAAALPLALLIDTAWRSLLWFDDPVFQQGILPLALTAVLAALALGGLGRLRTAAPAEPAFEPGLGRSLPFAGAGLLLYLAMFVYYNPAYWQGLAPAWGTPLVYLALNLLAAFGVLAVLVLPPRRWWGLACGALFAGLLVLVFLKAPPAWLWFWLSGLFLWAAAGQLLRYTAGAQETRPGAWRGALAVFLGLVLLLVIYFLKEQMSLAAAVPASGLLLAALAAWAGLSGGQPEPPPAWRFSWLLVLAAPLLVGAGLWLSRPTAVDGTPLTAVFRNGEEGYACFRIPSLVTAGDGSLVAFAEGRVDNCADFGGPIRIVARRSTDNGRTWGPLQVVARNVLPSGVEKAASSPSPVVDLKDLTRPQGRIVLLFNMTEYGENDVARGLGVRRVYHTESLDNGLTWSAPRDITSQVHRPNNPTYTAVYPDAAQRYNSPEDWRQQVPAVGHAIQLRDGRLLYTASITVGKANVFHSQNYLFWSHDRGRTWQIGGIHPAQGLNEAMAVELEDGRVMVNARAYLDNQPVGLRSVTTYTVSKDTAQTGPVTYDAALVTPTVQASIHRYSFSSDAKSGGKSRILFSMPDHPRLRVNMTVRLSYDEGKIWAVKKTIDPGPSAYSDLAVQADGKIGLLYERGNDGGIFYTSFSLGWLGE
jgi:sialidase-1